MQPAQGAKVLAELPHEVVDQGPDGRARPQVIMSNPEISAWSEGQDKPRVVRGMMSKLHAGLTRRPTRPDRAWLRTYLQELYRKRRRLQQLRSFYGTLPQQ